MYVVGMLYRTITIVMLCVLIFEISCHNILIGDIALVA